MVSSIYVVGVQLGKTIMKLILVTATSWFIYWYITAAKMCLPVVLAGPVGVSEYMFLASDWSKVWSATVCWGIKDLPLTDDILVYTQMVSQRYVSSRLQRMALPSCCRRMLPQLWVLGLLRSVASKTVILLMTPLCCLSVSWSSISSALSAEYLLCIYYWRFWSWKLAGSCLALPLSTLI